MDGNSVPLESKSSSSSRNVWIIIITLLALGLGLFFYLNSRQSREKDSALNLNQTPSPNNVSAGTPLGTADTNTSIEVEGGMFYFKPNRIEAKVGQPITIRLTSVDGMHDFVIDELSVNTEKINIGESETITFTPSKAGEFEFYCSVGAHRQNGMIGILIVK